MNETPTAPVATSKRTKKQKTPRAPRVVDPAVLAIRKEASEKVKEYHRSLASGGVLNTIITKLVPKLTAEDRDKLVNTLLGKPAVPPLT